MNDKLVSIKKQNVFLNFNNNYNLYEIWVFRFNRPIRHYCRAPLLILLEKGSSMYYSYYFSWFLEQDRRRGQEI